MELTMTYVISQVFTIAMYALLAITYYVKNRKTILVLNFLALIANAAAYILLNAYSGLAVCIIALIRNIIFLIDEKRNGKREENTKKDRIILVFIFVLLILSAIYTYEGPLSLLSVIATMLYTYSVWQKKTKVYKLLGIFIEILWGIYNLYVGSIFGVILEVVMLLFVINGYRLEVKKKKQQEVK